MVCLPLKYSWFLYIFALIDLYFFLSLLLFLLFLFCFLFFLFPPHGKCQIYYLTQLLHLYIFKLFYCCSVTVVCIFFPSLDPTPAKPTSLPCFHPPPWFCLCVLYSSSWNPFSPLSLPPSPLTIVRLFLTSMSLAIFCLLFSFVDYVPVKGEIIWGGDSEERGLQELL